MEEFARAETRVAPLFIVECACSERTVLKRIRYDRGGYPAGDRSPALYHEVKARGDAGEETAR